MATSIHDFQSRFRGGVRPNLFVCNIIPPQGFNMEPFQYHCKATQLPGSTIGNVDVPYHGRFLKVPGDRTFADWTVTVLNDTSMYIRGVFEKWSEQLQHHHANIQVATAGIYGAALIQQLDRQGRTIRTYKITSMYPTDISAIDLAWDTNDTVEDYTVTFAINEFTTGQGNTLGVGQGNSSVGVTFAADSNGNIGGQIFGSIGF